MIYGPGNLSVHDVAQLCVSMWFSDFGSSMCAGLQLKGPNLPNISFSDPRMPWQSISAIDIFNLGFIFYAIMTGNWPFMDGPPDWEFTDSKLAYVDHAQALFN